MIDKQLPLARRVQEIMARENTICTLEESLYQLKLENEKRIRLEEELFDEQLIRISIEKKLKKFQAEAIK